jgi:arylsulfatase A-like enzyme
MRGPGIPENQTRAQLVYHLDIVATIEELAGVAPGLRP